MLSRRNVRVKVMQLLYAERQDSALTPDLTVAAFRRMVEQSYVSLLFDLYAFVRIVRESREEQKRKAARLVPSADDKAFKPHAFDNLLILNLANSPELEKAAAQYKFAELLDEERLRQFYAISKEWEGYAAYATAENPTRDQHLQAALRAHKALIDNEAYNDFLEDRFGRWDEDKSLIVGAAKKVFKSLPQAGPFLEAYRTDEETAEAFGVHLLRFVLDEDQRLLAYIEPLLKNWEAERVAVLDMIFLKMALGELLEFSQIPPKVTLNEYVELAKTYSTEKSKDFVNGVLDALLRTLREEGLIVKEGRGLIE